MEVSGTISREVPPPRTDPEEKPLDQSPREVDSGHWLQDSAPSWVFTKKTPFLGCFLPLGWDLEKIPESQQQMFRQTCTRVR